MTKLQLLHRALNERLMAAVEQIMEMVGGTVLEYEEETIRARKENEVLRRRLRWMEGANRADWPGPSEPVVLSATDEANPSRQDDSAVNFGLGPESDALVIKTESTDLPLCSISTLPQSIDQGSDNPGTGAGIAYGLADSMTWDSAQSYMAPLDFDPTSGPNRVRRWRGQNRRQRMSFACPDCGKVFGSQQRLIVHMRIHSTERPYAYRRRKACFYGDNKKKRKLHRLSQRQRKNDVEKEAKVADTSEHRCPDCGKVFFHASRLRVHMKSHKSKRALLRKSRPIKTELTKEETMEALPKTTELQNLKDPKKTYACPHCDKVFAREGWLVPHIRSQHGEIKNRSGYFNAVYGSGRTRSQQLVTKGPEFQTNFTDDNSSIFKIHHCCYCKQPHHRMMDHLQSVHPNEPEVAKALTFDKSSQERKQLLKLLQTRGNVLHNTNVVQKQCKGKSALSAEGSYGEMLPNAGPCPPTPTLISPSSPEKIDPNIEPSGFHCLNTLYEADFENEQGSSSLPDLNCNGQPDISSPNEEVRNNRQAEGAILQFRHSPENEVGYELKLGNSPNPSTGQESTDYKNEGVSLPKCDVDQERAMALRSYTSSTNPQAEYDVLRNPCDDFSPLQNAQSVCNNTPKSSVKAQTYGTRKKRRKRRSRVHNQSLIMDDDLLGEGEMSNSKLHVCQHCKATFGSPYTLRRHEYTHTGERPFWCHQCNVGFIQKYRLLKHTFACHGDTPDQEKLKRAKRSIQDEETSVRDEPITEPASKSPEDLPNAVTDDTRGKIADTRQDTEAREFHWEEAGPSKVKDYDTDC